MRKYHNKWWTKEQIEILKSLYPTTQANQVGKIVGKSREATMAKAHRLGIKAIPAFHRTPDLIRNPFQKLTDIQRGYMAGIMDGEGCIQIDCSTRIKIAVVNTYYPMLEHLKQLLGGSIIHSHKKEKAHHKQGYKWQLHSGIRCYHLLSTILPLLIIKHDRAKQAIYHFQKRNLAGSEALKVNLI